MGLKVESTRLPLAEAEPVCDVAAVLAVCGRLDEAPEQEDPLAEDGAMYSDEAEHAEVRSEPAPRKIFIGGGRLRDG